MAARSLRIMSKNRLDGWSIVGCIRFCHVSIFGRRSVRQSLFEITRRANTAENQKNPGNRGKGNGVNVSNGSSQSARKNTASVSAEPTTSSTINSLSCARLMACNTKRNGEKFHGGALSAPIPQPALPHVRWRSGVRPEGRESFFGMVKPTEEGILTVRRSCRQSLPGVPSSSTAVKAFVICGGVPTWTAGE
jgi:hypothetical protein